MKIRIVNSRNEIENLNPKEKMIHMRFRPTNIDLLNLMQRCPGLRVVQMSPTYYKALSKAIRAFMNMKGIELLAGNVWGLRKDPDRYFTVDDKIEREILALAKKGIPEEDIANEIKEEVDLSPDLIRYMITNKGTADRTKT